jgi:hypothetical protein
MYLNASCWDSESIDWRQVVERHHKACFSWALRFSYHFERACEEVSALYTAFAKEADSGARKGVVDLLLSDTVTALHLCDE